MAVGGGTEAGAHSAARRLIDEDCDALVSFGLAGGLDPALRPGALIVPAAVIVDGVQHATDPALSRQLGQISGHAVLGADAVLASAFEKRHLHERTSAAAVDLESGAVARIAVARRIPFAVLRAVCDPAESDLPPAAVIALDAHGAIAVWRMLASVLTRPRQLPALVTLAADAAVARRALVARVRQIAQRPA